MPPPPGAPPGAKKKKKKKKKKTPAAEPEPVAAQRPSTAPVQRPPDTSKEDAAAAKEAGNAAMKLGTPEGLEEAVQHYTRAITLDGGNHVYWSNRSAAHVSLGKAKAAISDAEMCVELNPGWIKGYARLGTALFLDGDYATAVATYKAGLRCADRCGLSSSLRAPVAL